MSNEAWPIDEHVTCSRCNYALLRRRMEAPSGSSTFGRRQWYEYRDATLGSRSERQYACPNCYAQGKLMLLPDVVATPAMLGELTERQR
jgi:hypothetical protein